MDTLSVLTWIGASKFHHSGALYQVWEKSKNNKCTGVGNHLMMMLHSMTWESSISYREGFKKINGIYH